jgi:hypothetical protein
MSSKCASCCLRMRRMKQRSAAVTASASSGHE